MARFIAAISTDCARLAALAAAAAAPDSVLIGSEANEARCCDRIDRFSSIGVKMLCDLRCGSFLMAESVLSSGGCGRSMGSDFGITGGGGGGSCSRRSPSGCCGGCGGGGEMCGIGGFGGSCWWFG